MMIPRYIKEATKVIGYFAYTSKNVFCDGDACIIADSEGQMKFYLKQMPMGNGQDIIRKTRFSEIIEGLRRGGAYAFDELSYNKFFELAMLNGMEKLPLAKEFFSEPTVKMHFIRIQMVG